MQFYRNTVAKKRRDILRKILTVLKTFFHSNEGVNDLFRICFMPASDHEFASAYFFHGYYYKLEVTIARKVLPHPQGIKGSMHNLLNKGLFI